MKNIYNHYRKKIVKFEERIFNVLKKNDVIELDINDISVEGAGIGRYDGQAVFVRGALPKERVNAKIIKTAKNYSIGIIEDIISRSQHRKEPFCPVFGKCGGCSLQHLDYPAQLSYKANYLKQCMKRIGGTDIEQPEIIASGKQTAYRNKASFPVAQAQNGLEAGFYAHHSHRVVPSYCAVQHPLINDVKDVIISWANEKGLSAYDEASGKGDIRHIVVRITSTQQIMAAIVSTRKVIDKKLTDALGSIKGLCSIVQNINTGRYNNILGEDSTAVFGDNEITEVYSGLKFKASLNSFLQINHDQTEKLYKTALDYAQIKDTNIVFDLFCGIGTISLLAAKQAKFVLGIEYVNAAADNAKANAELNGINNADFIAGDAGRMLDKGIAMAGRPDIVILDPPRKGCDKSLIDKLCEIKPSKIVYVSCSPSTLARDTALYTEQGYCLKEIKAVDMFPQTTHVESVISLVRV